MELLDEQSKSLLDEQGYVVLKGFLSDREVETIRGIVLELAAWEREQGEAFLYADDKNQRIWNIMNKHEVFRELIQRPLLMQAMEHIFKDGFILSVFSVNIVGSGGEESVLHADTHIKPLPEFPLNANSLWLLDDFTEDNGATIVLPGSHLLLKHPQPEDQNRADLVKIIAPKGSVVVTNGVLWHKNGHNQTTQERVVLLGTFCQTFMKPHEDYLRVLDEEVNARASPLLHKLLAVGYGVHKGARLKPRRKS